MKRPGLSIVTPDAAARLVLFFGLISAFLAYSRGEYEGGYDENCGLRAVRLR